LKKKGNKYSKEVNLLMKGSTACMPSEHMHALIASDQLSNKYSMDNVSDIGELNYAEGGDATNGMGTPPGMVEGIGGSVSLGTAAGIGGSVTFGTVAGTAGIAIGGSAAVFGTVGTAGTVTAGILGSAGIGGTAPTAGTAGILGNAGIGGTAPTAGTVGTAGIGGRVAAGTVGTTGGFGTAGMPGTAAGAAAGAVVVSARCRAAWHVLLPSSMMSAIITSAVAETRDEAAEAMATS